MLWVFRLHLLSNPHDLGLYWGPVNSEGDHTYSVGYTGHGGPLDLWYRDDLYGDNERDTNGNPYDMLVDVYRLLPAAPSNLTAANDTTQTSPAIQLAWKDNSSDEMWFEILRATGSGDFSFLAEVAADETSYRDTSVTTGTRYTYRVIAHTASDTSDFSNQAVTVLVDNVAPTIDPIPNQTAIIGKKFFYQVHGVDPDQPWQALTYSLVSPPSGLTINANSGYIYWGNPTGTSPIHVTLQANNGSDSSTGTFDINLVNAPSGLTLGSVTASFASPYTVHLSASASEGGSGAGITYTWKMARGPYGAKAPVFSASNATQDGASIDATFGPNGISGDYDFQVTARDALGNSVYDSDDVNVKQTPTRLRIEPRQGWVLTNTTHHFEADVLDQFGNIIDSDHEETSFTLNWSINGGTPVSGLAVNMNSGTAIGVHVLHVESPDDSSLSDTTQFYNKSNAAPVITSVYARPVPDTPGHFWLTATALDDGIGTGLSYTWSPQSKPTGSADPGFPNGYTGNRILVTGIGNGPYVFQVSVSDGTATSTQNLPLDTTPVPSSLVISPGPLNVTPSSSAVTLSATGLDQFGQTIDINAIASDIMWSLDGATGVKESAFSWTPPSSATKSTIVATYINGSINASGTTILETVAQTPPTVEIKSPHPSDPSTVLKDGIQLDGTANVVNPIAIATDTDVLSLIDDPNAGDVLTWTLTAVPADGGSPITLVGDGAGKRGVGMKDGEKIGTIHPLLMPQGLYTLTLTANDGVNAAVSATRQMVITTPLKLGNLSLPVTDLTVQGKGLPISISRVYDSSRANKYDAIGAAGDFGPGWRLELPDTDMQVTAMTRVGNRHEDQYQVFPTFLPGDAVYFTLAGGDVEGFEFDPQPGGFIGNIDYHLSYAPSFRPLNGSNSRLTGNPDELPTLVPDGSTGEFFDETTALGYNPARPEFGGLYYLTTHDGTQYVIDAKTGMVQTITDPNGNRLKYNLDGNDKLASIDSDNTANSSQKTTVTIHRRTSDGRIDWVEDDIGTAANSTVKDAHSIVYDYNGTFPTSPTPTHPGELKSVKDRAGNTTQYGYADNANAVLRYHLTSITDPRNLPVLSATYNADTGEMTSLSDPYKKTAGMGDTSFAGADARKSVTDLAGNKTEMVYDYRGRPVRQIAEIKTNGVLSGYRVSVTSYGSDYDPDHNVYFLSSVTQYQPFTLTLAQADQRHDFVPSVIASETDYDRQGNVISQIDAAGRVTTLSGYTAAADDAHPVKPNDSRPTLTGDAYGDHTNFAYDTCGNLTYTTNSASERTNYTYDQGKLIKSAMDRGSAGEDNDDAPTSESEYNGPDGQISVSKSDFRKNGSSWVAMTERDYDYTPLTIGTNTYRRETVTLKWRDVVTDSAYPHTLTESITLYDADDRTWKVTDSSGRVTETQYNSLGKVAATIDPFGGKTLYDYDARGQLIRTIYPDKTETRTVYDDMGRVTWQSDRYAGNSIPANGVIDNSTPTLASLSIYDEQGRAIENRRYSGVLITLSNDDRLASTPTSPILRSDATGGTLLSINLTKYDSAGRASSTTDAAGVTTQTTYYDDGRAKNTQQFTSGLSANPGTSYGYDFSDSTGLHRQDRVTDALGHLTTTDYDNLGHAVKVTYDDDGSNKSFTETLYGTGSHAISRSDIILPDNTGTTNDFPSSFEGQHVVKIAQHKSTDSMPPAITHYLYDVNGRLTDVWQPKVHDAASNTDQWPHWQYEYDALGNLTKITDPVGHHTDFADSYDSYGHKTGHTRTLPAISGTSVTETTTYDGLGRTLSVQDFKGQTTAYDYDDSPQGQGRLFAEYRFATSATVLNASNQIIPANAAERTEYTYDALGRQSQVREYASGTTSTTSRVTNYSYDPITGAVSLVDSPEGKLHYVYDAATGRMTETWTGADSSHVSSDTLYGYDPLGRLKSVSSAKINGSTPSSPHAQLNRFNASGQIVSGNTLPTTTYDYDAVGNLQQVNLPSGNIEEYVYDHLNRLTQETITRPDNPSYPTEEVYDYTLLSNGQRDHVIETHYNGTTGAFSANKISWTYDTLGRLTSETRDVGNDGQNGEDYIASFSDDQAGNRLEKVFNSANDTHDETIDYIYDARDRLGSEDSNVSGNDVSYTYDANGSMTSMTKGSTTTAYVWDLRNGSAASMPTTMRALAMQATRSTPTATTA